jgi:hypothetical protein
VDLAASGPYTKFSSVSTSSAAIAACDGEQLAFRRAVPILTCRAHRTRWSYAGTAGPCAWTRTAGPGVPIDTPGQSQAPARSLQQM